MQFFFYRLSTLCPHEISSERSNVRLQVRTGENQWRHSGTGPPCSRLLSPRSAKTDAMSAKLAGNKQSAKQGRRAAPSTPSVSATPAADIEQDEDLSATMKQNGGSKVTDRPSKAVSGWGEDAPRKPRARQLGEGLEIVEDERLRPSSPDKGSEGDSDNDIPVIPELEEQQEEDLTARVASAPNVAVNRVATYRELDNDLLRQAAFQILDNEIDLKLLTKGLSPLEDLIEEDRPWDWDRLFTEVSSELTTEWEKAAGEAEAEQVET